MLREKSYFNSKVLCTILDGYDEIVIYGTGNYAKEIYPYLVKFGLKGKIAFFTQTNVDEIGLFDGISVVSVKMLNCRKKDCVVLVAVSQLYVNSIKETLLGLEYQNIVYLVDYEISYEQYCILREKEFLNSNTFEEYCELIADWYIEGHTDHLGKNAIVKKLLKRGKCSDGKVDSNLVVIICGYLTSRTIKLIGALKTKNFNIVILNYCIDERSWNLRGLEETKVVMHKCQCIEELLYITLQYSPLVYYFEPRWGDCRWAEIMFMQKRYFGKVILALYDVMNDGYVGIDEEKLTAEKKALELADGIVWRWFSKEYLEEKGFHFQGRSIQFIDYCSHIDIDAESDYSNSNVIKLCLVAGNGNQYFNENTYKSDYFHWAQMDDILKKIGNKKDCIFHFYAGVLSEKNIYKCKQYKIQYTNFDFFLSVEYGELLTRLKRYDFGCDLCVSGKMPPEYFPIGKYYGSVFKNSIRNVYFDFLSAGLPVITTQPIKMWEYLSSYNVVVPMNLDNLDVGYLKENKEIYKKRVRLARQKLDINYQIVKLIHFFQEV